MKLGKLMLASVVAACLSAPVAADDARFEGCRTKLIAAQKLDLLHALDWKPPKEPYVVVGPTFSDIAIDAKQGFAETVNCFLMAGDEGKLVNFDLLDWRTGNAVARYANGKLKVK